MRTTKTEKVRRCYLDGIRAVYDINNKLTVYKIKLIGTDDTVHTVTINVDGLKGLSPYGVFLAKINNDRAYVKELADMLKIK